MNAAAAWIPLIGLKFNSFCYIIILYWYYTYIQTHILCISVKNIQNKASDSILSTELAKNRKIELREENAAQEMEFEEVEGLLYGPGIAEDW